MQCPSSLSFKHSLIGLSALLARVRAQNNWREKPIDHCRSLARKHPTQSLVRHFNLGPNKISLGSYSGRFGSAFFFSTHGFNGCPYSNCEYSLFDFLLNHPQYEKGICLDMPKFVDYFPSSKSVLHSLTQLKQVPRHAMATLTKL
ncbi:hypothetical protein HD806DRAFT_296250 [Xylariaceae sp. AK1471]|nr:hypothetical protein HD806DRAFT_296250 [Xylariaceae sp. AK1471]